MSQDSLSGHRDCNLQMGQSMENGTPGHPIFMFTYFLINLTSTSIQYSTKEPDGNNKNYL